MTSARRAFRGCGLLTASLAAFALTGCSWLGADKAGGSGPAQVLVLARMCRRSTGLITASRAW